MNRIMANFHLLFGSVWYLCLVPSNSCPVRCNCVTNSAHPSADCSYRGLDSVPTGLPFNISQISLSANSISTLNTSSFAATIMVKSLWLAYNQITSIQPGTFKGLSKLMSIDLSHNQLLDFPWSDLPALHELQVLILNNNNLVTLPANTFITSRSLRSLQLSSNKILSLPEGLFDSLTSLSHLSLYNNPFNCSCSLFWLKDWVGKSMVTIDKKKEIACSFPKELSGVSLEKLPDFQCRAPLQIQSNDPLLDKALFLCKKAGDQDFMTSHSKEIEVMLQFMDNGNIFVTPIKKDIVYNCRLHNHTAGITSLSNYQASGWLREEQEKLLLIMVSERGNSAVNVGSISLAISMLICLAVQW
ncbi:immunoglobulin superfamily containing leucine-rich repeat protein-like [Pelobates fuscus]|uniref:immunoglobulin superfamily containing leucine-rich repeat protein-like n=1 Tax=Pelobates fuscus TaxID=191477 RepID=UPI002FE44590